MPIVCVIYRLFPDMGRGCRINWCVAFAHLMITNIRISAGFVSIVHIRTGAIFVDHKTNIYQLITTITTSLQTIAQGSKRLINLPIWSRYMNHKTSVVEPFGADTGLMYGNLSNAMSFSNIAENVTCDYEMMRWVVVVKTTYELVNQSDLETSQFYKMCLSNILVICFMWNFKFTLSNHSADPHSTQTAESEVHASLATEWPPTCLHKLLPRGHQSGYWIKTQIQDVSKFIYICQKNPTEL